VRAGRQADQQTAVPERIEIVFDDVVVASHPRRFERGQTCYDWRHYLSVVERKPGR
jgi:uncharacterized protein (DUF427 family)